MTIDEAIKHQEELHEGLSEEMVTTYGVAIKLGIEALKEVQRIRSHTNFDATISLPGETEE